MTNTDHITMHLLNFLYFLILSLTFCIFSSFHQADLLDVVGVLYIGGLPKNYTTKRIGPVKKQNKTHTLYTLFCTYQ